MQDSNETPEIKIEFSAPTKLEVNSRLDVILFMTIVMAIPVALVYFFGYVVYAILQVSLTLFLINRAYKAPQINITNETKQDAETEHQE